jgi:hypothetical protein
MSDQIVDAAKETASGAVERGKQVAEEAAETAKQSSKEQGQELASTYRSVRRNPALPPRLQVRRTKQSDGREPRGARPLSQPRRRTGWATLSRRHTA